MGRCLLSLCCFLYVLPVEAKIWRVNNNTGVAADYATVQAAHNAAVYGDTIHLEPSINSSGDLPMSKRLVIIITG